MPSSRWTAEHHRLPPTLRVQLETTYIALIAFLIRYMPSAKQNMQWAMLFSCEWKFNWNVSNAIAILCGVAAEVGDQYFFNVYKWTACEHVPIPMRSWRKNKIHDKSTTWKSRLANRKTVDFRFVFFRIKKRAYRDGTTRPVNSNQMPVGSQGHFWQIVKWALAFDISNIRCNNILVENVVVIEPQTTCSHRIEWGMSPPVCTQSTHRINRPSYL